MLSKNQQAVVLQRWKGQEFEAAADLIVSAVESRLLGLALVSAGNNVAVKNSPAASSLAEIMQREERWLEACSIFRDLRHETLKTEKNGSSSLAENHGRMFYENLAKVLCNLSSPHVRFDSDSPKWAIICLMNFFCLKRPDESEILVQDFLSVLVE